MKNITVINIDDTDFDEENIGNIAVSTDENLNIGIQVQIIENGKAKIWLNSNEAKEVVLSLKIAIETIKDNNVQFVENEIKHITTMNIKDTDLNTKNNGVVIIEVFNKQRIGFCISLINGADPEIWLDVNSAEKVAEAIEVAINTM